MRSSATLEFEPSPAKSAPLGGHIANPFAAIIFMQGRADVRGWCLRQMQIDCARVAAKRFKKFIGSVRAQPEGLLPQVDWRVWQQKLPADIRGDVDLSDLHWPWTPCQEHWIRPALTIVSILPAQFVQLLDSKPLASECLHIGRALVPGGDAPFAGAMRPRCWGDESRLNLHRKRGQDLPSHDRICNASSPGECAYFRMGISDLNERLHERLVPHAHLFPPSVNVSACCWFSARSSVRLSSPFHRLQLSEAEDISNMISLPGVTHHATRVKPIFWGWSSLRWMFQIRRWPHADWHQVTDERTKVDARDWIERRPAPLWLPGTTNFYIAVPATPKRTVEIREFIHTWQGREVKSYGPGPCFCDWCLNKMPERLVETIRVPARQESPVDARPSMLVSIETTKSGRVFHKFQKANGRIVTREVVPEEVRRKPPPPEDATRGVIYLEQTWRRGTLREERNVKGPRGLMRKKLQYHLGVTARLRCGGTPDDALAPSKTFSHAIPMAKIPPPNTDTGDGDFEGQSERYLDGKPSVFDRVDIKDERQLIATDVEGVVDDETALAEAKTQDETAAELEADRGSGSIEEALDSMMTVEETGGGRYIHATKYSNEQIATRFDEAARRVGLSHHERRVAQIYWLQHKGAPEIAKRLDISRSWVSQLLRRATQALGIECAGNRLYKHKATEKN